MRADGFCDGSFRSGLAGQIRFRGPEATERSLLGIGEVAIQSRGSELPVKGCFPAPKSPCA